MEITANAVQTVATGADVLFDSVLVKGSSSIIYRQGSGIVNLRGICNGQCRARFRVHFDGNTAIPTGGTPQAVSLAIAIDGEAVPFTTSTVTSTVAGNFFNVNTSMFIDVPIGCCEHISIKNITPASIEVKNANLIIERVA